LQSGVRRSHPLRTWHRGLSLRAARAASATQGRAAEDVAQLAEQHQRELHREHERDEPRERRLYMTGDSAAGAAREARRIQRQRAGDGEQQRPADRDEHDRHKGVAPHPRQMRQLRDR
jgi:hypothetical protein